MHSWEMRALLYDLHRTDALLQISGKQYESDEVRDLYYGAVLEKHGVTQAQFDSSLVWYTAHPNLFNKIYPKVLAELKEEEQEFLKIHPEFDARLSQNKETQEKPTIVFTRADYDSVLWVMREGYPNSWKPLVRDFKDELFPQIGVLRGGVVDTLQTSIEVSQVAHD